MRLLRGSRLARGLAAVWSILLGVGLFFGAGVPIGDAADIGCSQSALQATLDSAVAGTPLMISMTPNCTLNLQSPGLSVGPGVDITIEGRQLTLDGGDQSFELVTIDAPKPSTSAITLKNMTLQHGRNAIYDVHLNSTVTIIDSTIQQNASLGIVGYEVNVSGSTLRDNQYRSPQCRCW